MSSLPGDGHHPIDGVGRFGGHPRHGGRVDVWAAELDRRENHGAGGALYPQQQACLHQRDGGTLWRLDHRRGERQGAGCQLPHRKGSARHQRHRQRSGAPSAWIGASRATEAEKQDTRWTSACGKAETRGAPTPPSSRSPRERVEHAQASAVPGNGAADEELDTRTARDFGHEISEDEEAVEEVSLSTDDEEPAESSSRSRTSKLWRLPSLQMMSCRSQELEEAKGEERRHRRGRRRGRRGGRRERDEGAPAAAEEAGAAEISAEAVGPEGLTESEAGSEPPEQLAATADQPAEAAAESEDAAPAAEVTVEPEPQAAADEKAESASSEAEQREVEPTQDLTPPPAEASGPDSESQVRSPPRSQGRPALELSRCQSPSLKGSSSVRNRCGHT